MADTFPTALSQEIARSIIQELLYRLQVHCLADLPVLDTAEREDCEAWEVTEVLDDPDLAVEPGLYCDDGTVRCSKCRGKVATVDLAWSEHRLDCEGGNG